MHTLWQQYPDGCPCSSSDWYCQDGNELTLSYPIPYTDLLFRYTT